MKELIIDNSLESAIKNAKWKNPGADLYDTLMDSFYSKGDLPTGSKELDDAIKNGDYKQWYDFLEEAYLVAPVKEIKNSPYGRTPFSRSGCKYPHHVVKGNKLVLSVHGVKAAYSRACQTGDINKEEIKNHLKRHFDDLHLDFNIKNPHTEKMNENFNFIYDVLYEMSNGVIDLPYDGEYDLLEEKSHGTLKYAYRIGLDLDTGKEVAIKFKFESGDQVTNSNEDIKKNALYIYNTIGDKPSTSREEKAIDSAYDDNINILKKSIKKTGHIDFITTNMLVDSIFTKDGKSLKKVRIIGLFNDHLNSFLKSFIIYFMDDREDVTFNDIINHKDFCKDFLRYFKNYPKDIERYEVGKYGGARRYKTTKLLWDKEWLYSYRFTPVLRGFNKKGRIDNFYDARDYLNNPVLNKFKENTVYDFISFSESTFYDLFEIRDGGLSGDDYEIRNLPGHYRIRQDANIEEGLFYSIEDYLLNEDFYNSKKYKYISEHPDLLRILESSIPSFTERSTLCEHSDLDSDEYLNDKILTTYLIENKIDSYLCCKTPEDLLKWMDRIQYGWVDKSGNIRNNEEDDKDFFKKYKLQSPDELEKSKAGVCWDQTELERKWFTNNNYEAIIFYIEIMDGKDNPTHTFLIYKNNYKNKDEYCWFEHSWEMYKGIHKYVSLAKAIRDVIKKNQEFNNDSESRVICRMLSKPQYGISCEKFMNFARDCKNVNLKNIRNELFKNYIGSKEDNYFDDLSSKLDSNFKKEKDDHLLFNLDDMKRRYIKKEDNKKYKDQGKLIKYMRDYDPKENDWCYIWIDKMNNYICSVTFDKKPNKEDGHTWISGLDIAYRYRGYGLTYQILDFCVKRGVDALTVQYDNEVAIKAYKKYGFEISPETKKKVDSKASYNYDMFLSDKKKKEIIKESIDWIDNFVNDDEFRESVDDSEYNLFDEKSHGILKYAYRIGFDIDTYKMVAIEFEFEGDKDKPRFLNGALLFDADKLLVDNAKNNEELKVIYNKRSEWNKAANENINKITNNIRKTGHNDFYNNEMKVHAIFYKNGKNINNVKFIPLFQKEFTAEIASFIDAKNIDDKNITIEELFEIPEFIERFKKFIKRNEYLIEKYTVGKYGGAGKFKTTKLLWDKGLLLSYKYTPILRGYNKKGRGENIKDAYNFLNKGMNNKFKECTAYDIINFTNDIFDYLFETLDAGMCGNNYRINLFPESRNYIIHDNIEETLSYALDIYLSESSHGKLKYDFRFGWDAKTGHQIKVVYSLDNIDITGVGDFYFKYNPKNINDDGSLKMDEDKYLYWIKRNINKKGNVDHQSTGQTVLAIVDLVTNKRLKEVNLLNPYCPGINTHNTIQTPENLAKANKSAKNNSNYIVRLKENEIDNSKTFKSTKWFNKVIDDKTGENLRFNKLAKAEYEKSLRGARADSIVPRDFDVFGDNGKYTTRYNPNKKEALQELYLRERDINNWLIHLREMIRNNECLKGFSMDEMNRLFSYNMKKLHIIQDDIDTIEKHGKYNLSMMKKYRESDENIQIYKYNTNLTNLGYNPDSRISMNHISYFERVYNDNLISDDLLNAVLEGYDPPLSYINLKISTSKDWFPEIKVNPSKKEFIKELDWRIKLITWNIEDVSNAFDKGYFKNQNVFTDAEVNQIIINSKKKKEYLEQLKQKLEIDKEYSFDQNIVKKIRNWPRLTVDNSNVIRKLMKRFFEVTLSKCYGLRQAQLFQEHGVPIPRDCRFLYDESIVNENKNYENYMIEHCHHVIFEDMENNIIESYDPPLSYDKLPDHLRNDPIHSWRAKTGIELIHKEPSVEELDKIWKNWNLMDNKQKEISDKKSMELFGLTNAEHYMKLKVTYLKELKESFGDDIMNDDLDWVMDYLMEDGEDTPEENKEESMPKKTDAAESNKNGVRRKKLYIAFIEWAKAYNSKNTFGSLFDKDTFNVTYPFVPEEMRYFYRLANPILCVLAGDLTFFQVSELRKLNSKNSNLGNMMIFAATPNDMRVFNNKDKKVYRAIDKNGALTLQEVLGQTFDLYIQNMIKKGDILNGPIDDNLPANNVKNNATPDTNTTTESPSNDTQNDNSNNENK